MSIEKMLRDLGKTADQVALTLLYFGFTGQRCSVKGCPVIRYINSDPDVAKWGGMKAPRPGVITWDDLQILDPICPQPVAEFMKRFDAGEFSELVRV